MTETFTYDDTGNRMTKTRNGSVVDYTHTSDNRIETRDGVVYTHDGNGNIVSKADVTGTTLYEYDYANRLKKLTMPDGTTAEYKYDALWRRTEKVITADSTTKTTRYLYDGFDMLAEYDETNTVRAKYLHNIGIDDPLAMETNGEGYYYHKDALGSITAITDKDGNIVQQYEYDAFGNITNRMNPPFKQPFAFTGRSQGNNFLFANNEEKCYFLY